MLRSRQQTYTFVAGVFILYAIFATTRTFLPVADLPILSSDIEPASSFAYDKEAVSVTDDGDCPEYGRWAAHPHEPRSSGRYRLPYQRPAPGCRKIVIPEVEEVIREMNRTIKDPDLFRLFENCFPNTLDTSVTWTGVSSTNIQEELTFITTGDIHAMWLRDSANQLQSYVSLLKPPSSEKSSSSSSSSSSTSSSKSGTSSSDKQQPGSGKLASLFRGAINLQSRYILASPHCNAFQPPVESGIEPADGGHRSDFVSPPYSDAVVFECKYELDSLASFLQLSWDYYSRTKDARFFVDASSGGSSSPTAVAATGKSSPARKKGTGKAAKGSGSRSSSSGRASGSKKRRSGAGKKGGGRRRKTRGAMDGWKDAVEAVLQTAEAMRAPTYKEDGMVPDAPYRFTRVTSAATETLPNGGNGSPVKGGTGMVRSAFRPSDDATTFQFLVPANMMLARYMGLCAEIVDRVEKEEARVAAAMEAVAAAAAAAAASSSSSSSGKGSSQDVVGGTSGTEDYYGDIEDEEEEDEADDEPLADRMRRMAKEIKKGIETYGKIKHPEFGEIYAYEVDGYYSTNMMDDANLPSLLSSPLTGYVARTDPIYKSTRRFALSDSNPYYDHGPVINGTGGPHIGPGMAWPMSLVVGIMTSDDDDEIRSMLGQLLASTDGLGLMHESVNVWNAGMWTRAWFSWANGLFGQMILDLAERKPAVLKSSFQGEGKGRS